MYSILSRVAAGRAGLCRFCVWCTRRATAPTESEHGTATCIIIAPKRLKLRLSGSARKSQKRFRDTPRFKFRAVLTHCQPFLSGSVRKRATNSNSNAETWSIIMQFAVAFAFDTPRHRAIDMQWCVTDRAHSPLPLPTAHGRRRQSPSQCEHMPRASLPDSWRPAQ
jgi:hypothetical protein